MKAKLNQMRLHSHHPEFSDGVFQSWCKSFRQRHKLLWWRRTGLRLELILVWLSLGRRLSFGNTLIISFHLKKLGLCGGMTKWFWRQNVFSGIQQGDQVNVKIHCIGCLDKGLLIGRANQSKEWIVYYRASAACCICWGQRDCGCTCSSRHDLIGSLSFLLFLLLLSLKLFQHTGDAQCAKTFFLLSLYLHESRLIRFTVTSIWKIIWYWRVH